MTRIVFRAFSAYVGALTGRTSCAFWPDDPNTFNWLPAAQVAVDLSRSPKAARTGAIGWGNVDVDDHLMDGGLTTIGPLFPGGQVIGACWLSDTFLARLPGKPAQPVHAHDYELRSILYVNDPKLGDRRFHGFHARIVSTQNIAPQGKLSLVEIWNPGTGKAGGAPHGRWWLNLDDVAHPIDPDATQIPGPKGEMEGALFLDTTTKTMLSTSGGSGPKVPPGFGHDY